MVLGPDSVRFGAEQFQTIPGYIFKLPVLFEREDGKPCNANYTLSSNNTKVAQVNNLGEVLGVSAGWADITVTTDNGKTAQCRVGVYPAALRVELSAGELQMGIGMTSELSAKIYYASNAYFDYSAADAFSFAEFTSSNEKVATVDDAGHITAVAKGEATISLTTRNNVRASCKVTVMAEPTAIYLNKSELELGVGMTETLVASYNPYEYSVATFSSNNEKVATVDQDGKVTAVGVGTAIIKAETHNGKYTWCELKVTNAPDHVEMDISSANLSVGGVLKLNPVYSYQGGDDCLASLTYASSKSSVARVDEEGRVYGVATGSAIIRVFTQNGLYADCYVVVRPAATKVQIAPEKVEIGVGQKTVLSGVIYYQGGSFVFSPADTGYAHYEVMDESIVKVDEATGEITAIKEGQTYVRLRTYNDKFALCQITVSPGPDWIQFDDPLVTISVGQSRTLHCDKSAGSLTTRTYTSSDPKIATVVGNDATCTLTALAPGKVVITATSSNGRTATCDVTVMAAPQKVEFASDSITINLKETVKLPEISVTSDEGECDSSVTYTASNDNVTVSATGYVTGMVAGTVTVTATTYNGKSDTCEVRVLPEPSSISIESDADLLAVGDTAQLKVEMDVEGRYSFSAEPEGIVQIDDDGLVTAVAPGTATITVRSYNGLTDTCTIEVKAVPDEVHLNKSALKLGVGMTETLQASIPEDTLGTVEFESSNPAIAKVDAQGKVTAQSVGKATITASIAGHADVFDTCVVTVQAMPERIELDPAQAGLKTGATYQLTATLLNGEDTDCYGEVLFESSDNEVVEVSKTGLLTAISEGKAVITATASANDQITATCEVTVTDAKVRFDVTELTLGEGETYALDIVMPEGKDNFSIESDDPAVATVTEEGLIEAKSVGSCTITATNGGETATCEVTVASRPSKVELSVTEKQLIVGETFQLNPVLSPEGAASALTFKSNSPAIQVSAEGLVTAKDYGTAEIRVETYDPEVYAICTVTAVYEPEQIRFGELSDIVVAVGDSYTLLPPVMYNSKGECDATYTLSVSNSDCARVSMRDGKYVLTGLEEGSVTLRLKTSNGKTATLTAIVVEAPSAISFVDDPILMGVGESCVPQVIGDNDAWVTCTFTSEDEEIVRVENGQLVAVKEGKTTVTAQSALNEKLTAKVEVQVVAAPESVHFNVSEHRMGVGEDFKLNPVFDEGAASYEVSYASSNESVVQVDQTGYIVAVGAGKATVTGVTYNGHEAQCDIMVMAAPAQMSVWPQRITACVEDEVQLQVSFDDEDAYANVYFDSTNPDVAEVSESGLVTFKQTGEAVILLETFNGLTAKVPVTVDETPTEVSFALKSAAILVGDRAELQVNFDQGAGYYTLESSDPEKVRIAEDGFIEAVALGTATITLEMPNLGLSASCEVEVIDQLTGVIVTVDKDTLELHEQTQLNYALLPSNAVGTGLVHFESLNSDIASVDPETGVVTGEAYGTATLCAVAGDGTIGQCEVNVLGGKRRMFAACYSGEIGDEGYLPFPKNNVASMCEVFSGSTVEGQKYDVAGPFSNLPKYSLLSAIDSHFADATDDDVSVIYICAHGGFIAETSTYAFHMDASTYITGDELMDHVERIKGKVVIIMDSCYSGGLIVDVGSRLDAQGGRIAVMTASHEDTNSTWWNTKNQWDAVDMFTFALLQGLGYCESKELTGINRGWYADSPACDTNGDGIASVSETFNFARTWTREHIIARSSNSKLVGNRNQMPNSYIPAEMADMPLMAR